MIVWLNGELVREEDAAISIHDRGFLGGDGVFETALLHDGGFFRLRAHLDRFRASADMLRLPAPPSAELAGIARRVVHANGSRQGSLRFTLTRGVRDPLLLVSLRPIDASAADRAAAGWRIVTARTRRPSLAAMPGSLKALGRTHALLARIEAADAGVDDALLLTDDGFICEGPSWNIFWRTGTTLFTPALTAGVLPGITRSAFIELAPRSGFQLREGLFSRAELDSADEVFATMTSAGLVAIRELDGRPTGTDPSAAAVLLPAYRALVDREAAADPA